MIAGKQSDVQGVEEFTDNLKASLKDAQFAYKVSRARQAAAMFNRAQPHSYSVGYKVWINKSLFTDAYAKSQDSSKLTARRFGPYRILKLIGKNAVKIELPAHLKIHPVIHVAHTKPHYVQPHDIAIPVPERSAPVPTPLGDEYVVEEILAHRRRGRGLQFLTLMKERPAMMPRGSPVAISKIRIVRLPKLYLIILLRSCDSRGSQSWRRGNSVTCALRIALFVHFLF